jgi:hypothetical protein
MTISQRGKFTAGRELVKTLPALAPSLLTLDDVAKMLSTSKAWVRDHCTRRRPLIPVVRFGGRRAVLRFRPQDIERFINSNLFSTEEEAQ